MEPAGSPDPTAPSGDVASPSTAPNPAELRKSPKPRRRKRFRYLLACALLLLVAIAVAVPYLASTPTALSWVLPRINARLAGDIAIGKVSLSWLGECKLSGVSVTDAEKRQVLSVAEVSFGGGLWRAWRAREAFDLLRIESPQVVLYLLDDGSTSLARALSNPSATSTAPKGPAAGNGTLTLPTGAVDMRDASLRVVKADGRTYEVAGVDTNVQLAATGDVRASLSAELAGGGRLEGRMELTKLIAAGRLLPPNASGKLNLATDTAIRLAPLGDFVLADAATDGTLEMAFEGVVADGRLTADFKTAFAGLAVSRAGETALRPLDIVMDGRVAGDRDQLEGSVRFESGAGRVATDFSVAPTDFGSVPPWGDLLAAILKGESVRLPGMTLSATSTMDLPTVAAAVPSLMRLRPGTEITEGALTINNLNVTGGEEVSATGSVGLTALVGRREGQLVRMEPVFADFDVRLEPGVGLHVRRLELNSDFARVAASGTPSQLQAEVSGDVSKLHRQLAEFLEAGDLELAGTFEGDLTMTRPAEERIDLLLTLDGRQLRYRRGTAAMSLRQVAFRHRGSIALPAQGSAKFVVEEAVVDLEGRAKVVASGSYDAEQGAFQADITVPQADLQFLADRAGELGIPTLQGLAGDLQFGMESHVAGNRQSIEGSMRIESGANRIETNFSVAPSDFGSTPPWDDLLAAMVKGEGARLPGMTLNATGTLDLPTLAAAAPSVFPLRPGTEITEGTLTLSDLRVTGGEEASATGSVALTSLAGRREGRPIQMEAVSADFDVGLERGVGLHVRRLELSSDFARLAASGTVAQLEASMSGDLAKLHHHLAEFLDLGDLELGGTFAGDMTVTRASDDHLDTKVKLDASQIRYRRGAATTVLRQAAFRQQGSVALPARGKPKFVVEEAVVDLDGRAKAVASGWYDAEQGTYQADITVPQADLELLADAGAQLGVSALQGYAGRLEAKTGVGRAAAGAPLTSDGQVTLRDLRRDDGAFPPTIGLTWSGARFEPANRKVAVSQARLESAAGTFTADALECTLAGDLALSGEVKASADLAESLAVLARLGRLEQPPALAGRLELATSLRSTGSRHSVSGTATIEPFTLRLEDGSVFKDRVQLEYDGDWSAPEKRLSLRKATLTSGFLSTRVNGRIDDCASLCTLALDGDYDLDWGRLMTVLHELVPSTAETVDIRGRTAGPLTAKGPSCQAGVRPPFYDVVASTSTKWDSAKIYGLAMGPAELAPVLRQGVLQIPKTEIRSAEGWVRFGGTLDFTKDPPELIMIRKLHAMEEIEITQALTDQLLGRINPIFSQAASVQGGLSLLLNDLDMPLGPAALSRGSGSGTLNLESITMKPSGLLTELLSLGGIGTGEPRTVKLGRVDFRVENGRIAYDDLAMYFGDDFDLKFHGSVGLDDTLDLTVSMPLRSELLQKLGITGQAADYVGALTGERVDIPLTGTRQRPQLDFSKVDIGRLIKDAGTKGLLDGLKEALPDSRRDDQPERGIRDVPEERRKREPDQGRRRDIPEERRKREADEDPKEDIPQERRQREQRDDRGVRKPREKEDVRNKQDVPNVQEARKKRDLPDKGPAPKKRVVDDKRDPRDKPDVRDKRQEEANENEEQKDESEQKDEGDEGEGQDEGHEGD